MIKFFISSILLAGFVNILAAVAPFPVDPLVTMVAVIFIILWRIEIMNRDNMVDHVHGLVHRLERHLDHTHDVAHRADDKIDSFKQEFASEENEDGVTIAGTMKRSIASTRARIDKLAEFLGVELVRESTEFVGFRKKAKSASGKKAKK